MPNRPSASLSPTSIEYRFFTQLHTATLPPFLQLYRTSPPRDKDACLAQCYDPGHRKSAKQIIVLSGEQVYDPYPDHGSLFAQPLVHSRSLPCVMSTARSGIRYSQPENLEVMLDKERIILVKVCG